MKHQSDGLNFTNLAKLTTVQVKECSFSFRFSFIYQLELSR